VGLDCGPGVWIVHSRKPQSGRIDPWPAAEREVRKALGWSEERLLQSVVDYIKRHHCRAGEADYLLCRILNECERRLGQPLSAHPFTEDIEVVLGRESLVKHMALAVDPAKTIATLKRRYALGDAVITGKARDITGEVVRLLRPVLAGFKRHSKFQCFEVDNEPWRGQPQVRETSCWLDYTVIHARFSNRDRPITLCVFSYSCPSDREDAYYILATHHPKMIEYLRSHVREGGQGT
jgi:hypothetical protein